MTTEKSFADAMADLDALFDAEVAAKPVKAAPVEERHTCVRCAGSGKYRGYRTNQTDDTCFACGGRGWHKMSYKDRMERNAKRKATIATNTANRLQAFASAHPVVMQWLGESAATFEFAASLRDQLMTRDLSEKQIAAAYRCIEKRDAARAAKTAQATAKSGEVEVANIRQIFDNAVERGLKRPVIRAEGLALSLAPANGRNAGAIYVKRIEDDVYQGKIVGTKFMATREADAGTLSALQALSAEPREAAVRYGRLTGSCSCCGRELTDPKSIEMGIGPICASKWF